MITTGSSTQVAVEQSQSSQQTPVPREGEEQGSIFAALFSFFLPSSVLLKDREQTEAVLARQSPPPPAPQEQQPLREKTTLSDAAAERQTPQPKPQPVNQRGLVELQLKGEQWLPAPKGDAERLPPLLEGQNRSSSLQTLRALPVVTIQARSLPELLNGLSGRVRVMTLDGVQRARLQLDPPELGRLALQLESNGSHLKVHLITERLQVQEQLQLWLEQLKENLKLAGVEFDQVEVQVKTQAESEDAEFTSWLQTPVTLDEQGEEYEAIQQHRERNFGYNSFEMEG